MRTIYVDVLITVNIFIDFLLIISTQKLLHIKASYKRMILGSVLGGILSLAALLPHIVFILNILLDIFGAASIVFVSFGKCSLKNYIKRVAVYFSISFSFCGIMICVYTAFKPNGMAVYNDVVYFNISPVVLIILTLVCYYILKLIKRLTKGLSGADTCNVEVFVKNKNYFFCAKVDTGCNVKEPFSGYSVIVAEREIFDNLLLNKNQTRIIPFESLGGNGIIDGFRPDKIKIDGKDISNDIYIGICDGILKGDIKALAPKEIASTNSD